MRMESNAFREKVKSLLAAGKKKIVLNLANVGYIDSAGLGTLVATFHSAPLPGAPPCHLKLCSTWERNSRKYCK